MEKILCKMCTREINKKDFNINLDLCRFCVEWLYGERL